MREHRINPDSDVIGLIPAAGKGTRLDLPYPKELYPIISDHRYRPVAEYALVSLVDAGLRHVVFVVNETKHQLLKYFGSGCRFGCDISYAFQEEPPDQTESRSLGLAHALDSAFHLTRDRIVCFGMADTIMRPSDVFARALAEIRTDVDAVLIMFPTVNPDKFGMVRIDSDKRVEEIIDKPAQTDLTLMWGGMIWRPSFTEYLHACVRDGVYDFAEIMNSAIRDRFRFLGVPFFAGLYIDLGTYDEIEELHRLWV